MKTLFLERRKGLRVILRLCSVSKPAMTATLGTNLPPRLWRECLVNLTPRPLRKRGSYSDISLPPSKGELGEAHSPRPWKGCLVNLTPRPLRKRGSYSDIPLPPSKGELGEAHSPRLWRGVRGEVIISALIFFLCLVNFKAKAQDIDTLIFEWEVKANVSESFALYATPSEPFTVYWGDGSTKTYTAEPLGDVISPRIVFTSKKYAEAGTYRVTIIGSPTCKIPRTQGGSTFNRPPITYIDITKCRSMWALGFKDCKVRRVDASRATNPNLEGMTAFGNQLTLFWCDSAWKACSISAGTVPQYLELQTIARDSSVDFSADLWFTRGQTTVRTVFEVSNNEDDTPAETDAYTEEEGILTFYKVGNYKIKMTNKNVFGGSASSLADIAIVYQGVVVLPSTDANLLNLSVSEGVLTPAFDSLVYNYTVNVGYQVQSEVITATTSDRKASISGTGTKALQVGRNSFPVTVTAEDSVTTKTYTVEITRAADSTNVTEPKKESGLRIYPNPNTGKFTITGYDAAKLQTYEIYNATGQLLLQGKLENTSKTSPNPSQTSAPLSFQGGGGGLSETTIDVSHWANGVYLLKVADREIRFVKE